MLKHFKAQFTCLSRYQLTNVAVVLLLVVVVTISL